MSVRITPLIFEPIFKPKPWGGRELERLFGKSLPAGVPVGESWELSGLPGNESRSARGPHAGVELGEIMRAWGADLLGHAQPWEGLFPLLIKFLDAREKLSVQVHPRPDVAEAIGVKHEAWCVLDADAGAELYIGMKPNVGPKDAAGAASTSAVADLLTTRPAVAGDVFYLPSGSPHALGAGLVVAEVQTPSDVTYRLYDWGRVGLDGRQRELHIEQGLANIRYDLPETLIVQPRESRREDWRTIERLVTCERFLIDRVIVETEMKRDLVSGEMIVWIITHGDGILITPGEPPLDFSGGDVVLLPAALKETRLETSARCEALEVRIPKSRDTNGGAR